MFLGTWESVNNPAFNCGEFATIGSSAGLNNYKISVKEWVAKTNAISLQAKAGRYDGTYAHSDIAFESKIYQPIILCLIHKTQTILCLI